MGAMRTLARNIVMAKARKRAEGSRQQSKGKFRRFVFKTDWAAVKRYGR